jgi:hypothetical protein
MDALKFYVTNLRFSDLGASIATVRIAPAEPGGLMTLAYFDVTFPVTLADPPPADAQAAADAALRIAQSLVDQSRAAEILKALREREAQRQG